MAMGTPLRVSSTMQLPTATTQGAERHLMRQRDKQIGESIESGGGDGDEHATEGEQHNAAARRDDPKERKCGQIGSATQGVASSSTAAEAMAMSRPLRLSSTMQLPTVTRQGAERQLQTQRDTTREEQRDEAAPCDERGEERAAEQGRRWAAHPPQRQM